jgi:5-methylcytosine-specific restriction endonuclease McrA
LLPNHLPHRLATPDTPDVDLAALKRCRERQEQEWQDRLRSYQEENEAKRREWFEAHNEYLQTDEWQEKREAVLDREDSLCQGCRAALATQIHHLNYDNWRDELLFQLVALCEDCHERVHGRKFR